ncbi:MAG: 3-phosphoserine/phosphohydroxythreonine transaminase [Deltaproteobacteria bacterium]|nr:MAG: 3-phosphoserine/phosphohydroxythreonine transaminase [Deltaproteobacteria bacterium]
MSRLLNFGPGPAMLPSEVLELAGRQMMEFPGAGMSILETSHRGKVFSDVLERTVERFRRLAAVPDDFEILFLGGGATLQFAMVPMNLARDASPAYAVTGAWSKKAHSDAKKVCRPHLVYDGAADGYTTVPENINVPAGAAYLYLASNETIGGVQWPELPDAQGVPLVVDASSDILTRPVPWERVGLLFAGAQKNLGPAGATLVVVRRELAARSPDTLPIYLSLRAHVEKKGVLNTPPVFAVYMVGLVLEWLEERGGLGWAMEMARKRSRLLYEAIDGSEGFYRCAVDPRCRSKTNVVFRLPDERLEQAFLAEAESHGMVGLKGHRSVGGIRASLYNAMPLDGAERLAEFMRDFAARNG